MSNTIRTLLFSTSFLVLLWAATFNATGEEPKKPRYRELTGAQAQAQAGSSTLLYQCTAYLKQDYIDSIKPADILDGNKLLGTFLGFDGDFAKFHRLKSKQLIVIPKSAILYMIGDEHILNF